MIGQKFPSHLQGLFDQEVIAARKEHGLNIQYQAAKNTGWKIIWNILKDPMLILLFFVAAIYFIIGDLGEAYFMIGAIVMVSGISFYQDNRSRIAIEALESLTAPVSRVIRNKNIHNIPTQDIVPGDLVIAEEGSLINADGIIVYSHDFSVNESSLTGESNAVYKSEAGQNNLVYSGTMVSSGMAVYKVEKTGLNTKLGLLGTSIFTIPESASPLQIQIESFVWKMSLAGIIVFLLVWFVSYLGNKNLLDSLLTGLTLAMSVLPEEIPVAFTTFMALGSRRLIREGVLVKKTRTVETLGNASVICTDKTGTITENRMALEAIYIHATNKFLPIAEATDIASQQLLEAAMWASESLPFDPMEKSIHEAYEKTALTDNRPEYSMAHEYPLGGVPPMMTHVFENQVKSRIIATKGAPEAIIKVSDLSHEEIMSVNQVINDLAKKGYRILGVATTDHDIFPLPAVQQDIKFRFSGLLAFYDPPKKNIEEVFRKFYTAGIKVKIITGDNPLTTQAIAQKAGLHNAIEVINGDDLKNLEPVAQLEIINNTNIFTRMFPEAKLMTINALRKNNEIVAMIGDGVNDGPALKAADIGIAMGQKGTEIAKNAADLILLNDNLETLVTAIATGRRIYSNLKKAVQYIVSIHIPIIVTVSLPLFLGWIYPHIFTPVHVIFLELIMGPTCSIVYENEPIEKNAMREPPRPPSYSFLNWSEMALSILQGIIISVGVLFIYQYAVSKNGSEDLTRTLVFISLIFANIFLTLVNRSFYFSFMNSLRNKNALIWLVIGVTVIMLFAMIFIPFVRDFFHLTIPYPSDVAISFIVAAASVFWFEGWKYYKRSGKAGSAF